MITRFIYPFFFLIKNKLREAFEEVNDNKNTLIRIKIIIIKQPILTPA